MTPGINASADSGSSIYDSGASNLDILESVGNTLIDEKSPAAAGSEAGATDTAAPGASGDGAAGDAAVARPEWFEAAPAEFRALIEQSNVSAAAKKWLEETYGELHGFRSSPIGTKEAVQEVSELFPGGVEDMRVAHEQSQLFAREMEQFRSGDSTQQGELLAGLLQDENGPEAFISLTGNAIDLLKETLPRDYTQLATGITSSHLNEVTDGKFGTFFDSVRGVAAEYQAKVDAGDAEGAARLASKLGGYALQMADWWGGAKTKLGFGEKQADGAAGLPRPSLAAVKSGVDPNDKEVIYAQRDANYWSANHIAKHDSMVNPMIQAAMTRDLTARKLEVPETWKRDVMNFVASGIKQNLAQDKQYTALEARLYRRGAPNDPRRWDNSDKVSQALLNAVKSKADALVPVLMKKALDRLSELKGGAGVKTAVAGAGNRAAGGPASGGGGGGNKDWEAGLKDGSVSSVEALQRMAGLA